MNQTDERTCRHDLLGMFAKYWVPGAVKTRLAEGVGATSAAEVYRLFIATLLERFQTVGEKRQLVYAPADRHEEFAAIAGRAWDLVPQCQGDLGQRMARFFDDAFAGGAQRVVLIGSDSPLLPLEFIEGAFAALANHELVLGPCDDGGYYLIGAAGRTPPVFDGIDWSMSAVLKQSLERANAAGLRHKLLPAWYDVDQRADLERLYVQLRETTHWPELRTAVQSALGHR